MNQRTNNLGDLGNDPSIIDDIVARTRIQPMDVIVQHGPEWDTSSTVDRINSGGPSAVPAASGSAAKPSTSPASSWLPGVPNGLVVGSLAALGILWWVVRRK